MQNRMTANPQARGKPRGKERKCFMPCSLRCIPATALAMVSDCYMPGPERLQASLIRNFKSFCTRLRRLCSSVMPAMKLARFKVCGMAKWGPGLTGTTMRCVWINHVVAYITCFSAAKYFNLMSPISPVSNTLFSPVPWVTQPGTKSSQLPRFRRPIGLPMHCPV